MPKVTCKNCGCNPDLDIASKLKNDIGCYIDTILETGGDPNVRQVIDAIISSSPESEDINDPCDQENIFRASALVDFAASLGFTVELEAKNAYTVTVTK